MKREWNAPEMMALTFSETAYVSLQGTTADGTWVDVTQNPDGSWNCEEKYAYQS